MLILAIFGAAYAATKALEKGAEIFRDQKEAAHHGDLYRPVFVLAPEWGNRPEVKHRIVLSPSEIQRLDPEKGPMSAFRAAAHKAAWT